MPKWVHHLTTPLHHLAIWVIELSKASILRYHFPELVDYVNYEMLFEVGCYEDHEMPKHTVIDSMKNIAYNNCCWRGAFHLPLGTFWGSNHSIIKIGSCLHSLHAIFLRREYYLVDVLLIVSQLPQWWIPFSNQRYRCFTHSPMELVDLVEVIVLQVVRRSVTADRMTLQDPTICMKHTLSSINEWVKSTNNMLEDLL